jgi:hypothetical protein
MPFSDAHVAANPGKIVKINDSGTDIEYVDMPTGGGTPTLIDGGNASSTDTEIIDGGSAST